MTDGEMMLRVLLQDPWDEAGRLALSDWLEEAGEVERAESLRIPGYMELHNGPVWGDPVGVYWTTWPDGHTRLGRVSLDEQPRCRCGTRAILPAFGEWQCLQCAAARTASRTGRGVWDVVGKAVSR